MGKTTVGHSAGVKALLDPCTRSPNVSLVSTCIHSLEDGTLAGEVSAILGFSRRLWLLSRGPRFLRSLPKGPHLV